MTLIFTFNVIPDSVIKEFALSAILIKIILASILISVNIIKSIIPAGGTWAGIVELGWRSSSVMDWHATARGFDSRWERCLYRASRPSQGTVNGGGGAVSK